MTANQIKAAELFERKRSNLVNESLGRETLTETGRHNRAVESENVRHNTQSEAIDYSRVGVDRARVGVESSKLTETQRHNQAMETLESGKMQESHRHNVHSEVQGYINNATNVATGVGKIITMALGV